MRLVIKNLAKIKSADLKFDGITVVVGDNNTGKSTIGKTLYAVFNSMLNFTDRVRTDRYQTCRRILSDVLPRVYRHGAMRQRKEGDVISDFLQRKKRDDEIRYVIDSLATARGVDVDSTKLMAELEEVRKPTDEMMRNRLIRNYFFSVFNGQYISLYDPMKGALVDLTIKGKDVRVMLRKKTTSYKSAIEIQHPAYYVDSPDLIHAVAGDGAGASRLGMRLVSAIRDGIGKLSDGERSVVADVVNDEKLSVIYSKLYDVIKGKIEENDGGELVFCPNRGKKIRRAFDLDLGNLSQGLKSFGLLLAAIQYGAVKSHDVLILDEPEIHLHPDWQIKYAELIVLIQQAFGLTVLLTSHSADFIQAIRLFSKKYGTFGCVNAYVSKVDSSGMSSVDEVAQDDWDKVFSKFESAYDRLQQIESELEGH